MFYIPFRPWGYTFGGVSPFYECLKRGVGILRQRVGHLLKWGKYVGGEYKTGSKE